MAKHYTRFALLVLCACMLLSCAFATHALADTNARLDVSDDLSAGKGDGKQGVSIGTDLYLIVDPDTASYVTIRVVDEQGNILPNSLVYLNGELYGSTDERGKLNAYLFRDVKYTYSVTKYGYIASSGSFTATKATRTITVVLPKIHTLNVIVTEDGVPSSGISVTIDGETHWTKGKDGAAFQLPNGVYTAAVKLLDGTTKRVRIRVNGDTTYLIELNTSVDEESIRLESYIIPMGGSTFILFDKHYAPMDYLMTLFSYTPEERQAWADDETFEGEAFLHTLHIVSEPHQVDDVVQTDEAGNDIYTHRNLCLDGGLMLSFVDIGAPYLRLDNEACAAEMYLPELFDGDMAKLILLMEEEGKAAAPDGVGAIDFDALPEVTSWLDSESPMLTKAIFTKTMLELRITPILEMEPALSGALLPEEDESEVILVSGALSAYNERIRLDTGHMTETERTELSLLGIASPVYRVQAYLSLNDAEVNVTSLLKTLHVGLSGEALIDQFTSELTSEGVAPESVEAGALARLSERVDMTSIDTARAHMADPYVQGDYLQQLEGALRSSVPQEHLGKMQERPLTQFDVHIRLMDTTIADETLPSYHPDVTRLPDKDISSDEAVWHVFARSSVSGLHVLTWQ